jgi:transposase InsO family protein
MPRVGSRKLYSLIQKDLAGTPYLPGRDRLIDLLSDNGLLLKIRRRKRYKTTNSNHPYHRYPNLIKGMVFDSPNQAWASDITYVVTNEGVCYLSLVTDLYSRKIVGWALGDTLEAVYCRQALQMALDGLKQPEDARNLIHHSDRGCQYCSYEYVAMLKERGAFISMTESGDPLENAVAERINGIIKSEWLNVSAIPSRAACRERVRNAVAAYNNVRPHMSLDYQTPAQAHVQTGPQHRLWKTGAELRAASAHAHLTGEEFPHVVDPPNLRS